MGLQLGIGPLCNILKPQKAQIIIITMVHGETRKSQERNETYILNIQLRTPHKFTGVINYTIEGPTTQFNVVTANSKK